LSKPQGVRSLHQKEHLRELDGLRGLAALVVVLAHYESLFGALTATSGQYRDKTFIWSMVDRLCNGNLAVCTFFVLSGLVLTFPLRRSQSLGFLQVSAIKRYFRLAPPIFASLAVVAALVSSVGYWNSQASAAIGGHDWLGAPGELIRWKKLLWQGVIGVFGGDSSYNGVLWTMSYELWCSIFLFGWVSIFWPVRNYGTTVLLVGLLLMLSLGEPGIYASLFLVGSLFNRSAAKEILVQNSWWAVLLVPVIFLGTERPWSPFTSMIQHSIGWEQVPISTIFHAIAAVGLVFVVLKVQSISRLLRCRLFQALGTISFALYLVHLPVLKTIGSRLVYMLASVGLPQVGAGVGYLVSILLSLALAAMLTFAVDRPAMRVASLVGKKSLGALGRKVPEGD